MHKELIYTDLFAESLNEIRSYVAKDSITQAEIFIDKILEKTKNLEKFPYLGTKVEDNLYQYIINKNYLVYYVISESNILILYVIHVKISAN